MTAKTPGRLFARLRRIAVPMVLMALVTASLALLVVLYVWVDRPDNEVDASASHSAMVAASDGTVAILSYAPATIGEDLATAKSKLTGDFLEYYDEFTGQFVEPSAVQKGVRNTATVVRAAVAELHPESAKVLVFINQSTTTKEKPQPVVTASSVLVTVSKIGGKWLISSFDPNPA
jgi:Mce-associated membrane protein